jgi:Bacterial regulatory protein, Fis family
MGEALTTSLVAKLVVASACQAFLERCRDAFSSEVFPDLVVIEARSVRQLLLAIAPIGHAALLIDSRIVQSNLGDLIDMLHGGGFAGPIIAAAPQAGLAALPGCVAGRLQAEAAVGELRQAMASHLGARQIAGHAAVSDERTGAVLPLWIQERQIIERAIKLCGGNVGRAARALEISPSTIYRKLQGWQAH